MATRFYLPETEPAAVVVTPDAAWEVTSSPAATRRMTTIKKTASDALATTAAYTSTTGQDRMHRQYVSDPMAAGITFDTGVTYKCYVQCLESNADDNIVSRLGVRIVSLDGSVVRITILSVADYSTATEWNTTIRNKAFANGDAGVGSYVTVAGDRLVIEIGHNDASGATISASSRFGTVSAGGDSGEDETGTGATLAPWFETSATVTFLQYQEEFENSPDNTTLTPANTGATTITGTLVSDSGRAAPVGSFWAMANASAAVITYRRDFKAVSELWLRFYFQMDTFPPANNQLLLIRAGAGNAADLRITTTGTVQLRDQTLAAIDTSGAALAVDTTYRLELHITTTRWECRIFLGDSTTAIETESTLGGTISSANYDNLVLGVGTNATWAIWFDSLVLRTDTWVGPANASAAPAAVAGVGAVPAPTAQGAAIAAPGVVAGVGNVPAVTVTQSGTAAPAAVAGVGAVPSPTILGGAVATPAAVVGTGAVPAPTVQGAAIASPAAVAGIGAQAAVTAQGAAIALPASVVGVGAVPAPSVAAAAIAQPATVVGTGLQPAVTARGAAVASPAAVAGVGAVPAVTSGAGAVAQPAVVAGVGAVPVPTGIGAAVASPAAVAGVGAQPAVTAQGGAVASPGTVGAIGDVPTPTISAGAIATPAVVVGLGGVPSVTGIGEAVASPAAVAGVGSVPSLSAMGGARATPATVAGIGDVPPVSAFATGVGTFLIVVRDFVRRQVGLRENAATPVVRDSPVHRVIIREDVSQG